MYEALDAAQPGFENFDQKVRLHHTDAQYVDALHTNARPYRLFLGFGFVGPIGESEATAEFQWSTRFLSNTITGNNRVMNIKAATVVLVDLLRSLVSKFDLSRSTTENCASNVQ